MRLLKIIKKIKTLVIGTSEFDDFMDKNKLWDFALSSSNNSLIEKETITMPTLNIENLLEEDIGVNLHYLPVHLQPYYKKMGFYETTYILHSALQEGRLNDILNTIEKKIESLGAKILFIDNWGRKKLSYLIQKEKYGTYIFFQYKIKDIKNI